MTKRLTLMVIVALVGIGLAILWNRPESVPFAERETQLWLGPKDVELGGVAFDLVRGDGGWRLPISPEAAETISLKGYYVGDAASEENILVEKFRDRVSLQAWWVTPYGDTWLIDCEISAEDFVELQSTLQHNRAFELKNQRRSMSHAMTYCLTIKQGEREHSAEVFGVGWYSSTTFMGGDATVDPEWDRVVAAILGLRAQFAHQVRPAGWGEDRSSLWLGKTTGETLVERSVASQVAVLEGKRRPLVDEELTWEAVLDVGHYRNTKIVEAVARLLDDPRPDVSAAACAVMSWVSDMPPDPDREQWKTWWNKEAESYEPRVSSSIEGPYGAGDIRNLGRHAKGFLTVETDEHESVWALIAISRDWNEQTYELCHLDRNADEFHATGLRQRYHNKFLVPPSPRLIRRLNETGITFPVENQGMWVGPRGNWAAAILGHESEYHSDSVVVLDFTASQMRHPLTTDHQYAAPVVSSDGKYVAVAKGWNWANPNPVVVIDTKTEQEVEVPIPPSGDLWPIVYVDASPHGPGFYYLRGLSTLWWSNPNGTKAVKLLDAAGHASFGWHYNDVTATADGLRVFASRRSDAGIECGWLKVSDGDFEPVFPWSADEPTFSFDATADGDRVVFINRRKVYEWRRTAAVD